MPSFTEKYYANNSDCNGDTPGTDNSINYVLMGDTHESLKMEACCLGIDEAGRGPVLGPMVYGICYSPVSRKDELRKLGFADSKVLSESQREDLFSQLKSAEDLIGWIVEVLSPNVISNSMLRRHKYNLNSLSHDTAIGLIRKVLDKGVPVKEVYVDTVGDPAKYEEKLKSIFPDMEITVAKKADSTYPIVSAASICAKVTRDCAVKTWKFPEQIVALEYGSGYPGDEKTKRFLIDFLEPIFGFPQFVRFSWSTAGTLLEKQAARVSWEDDEEDDSNGTPSVLDCFRATQVKPAQRKHQYFKDLCLNSATDLF